MNGLEKAQKAVELYEESERLRLNWLRGSNVNNEFWFCLHTHSAPELLVSGWEARQGAVGLSDFVIEEGVAKLIDGEVPPTKNEARMLEILQTYLES